VYLGTLHHATTIAGLDHVLQGGWLGWIPYHDEMNYRDACRTITSYLPVSQDVCLSFMLSFQRLIMLAITRDYWRLLKITRDYWELLEITEDY